MAGCAEGSFEEGILCSQTEWKSHCSIIVRRQAESDSTQARWNQAGNATQHHRTGWADKRCLRRAVGLTICGPDGTPTRAGSGPTESPSSSRQSFVRQEQSNGHGLGIEPERVQVRGPDGTRSVYRARTGPELSDCSTIGPAPVSDSQYKHILPNQRVDDPIISNSQLEEPRKLTVQRLTTRWTAC